MYYYKENMLRVKVHLKPKYDIKVQTYIKRPKGILLGVTRAQFTKLKDFLLIFFKFLFSKVREIKRDRGTETAIPTESSSHYLASVSVGLRS